MAIDLFWDGREQKVFLLEFKAEWTWDDLDAVLQVTQRINSERRQLIGAILDFREGTNLPGGTIFNLDALNQFKQLLNVSSNGEDKGPLAIVGMSGLLRTIVDTAGRFNQRVLHNVHFVETLREARQVMRAQLEQRSANAPSY